MCVHPMSQSFSIHMNSIHLNKSYAKPRRYFNVTIQRFPSVSCQAGDFIGSLQRLVQVFDHHQEYLELNLYLACGLCIAEKTIFMNFIFGIGRNRCDCMFLYVQQTCPLVPLKMASLLFCPWTKLLVLPGWRKSLKMLITMVAFVFFMVRTKTC